MIRSRTTTAIDYSQQLAMNLDELDKRERLNVYDVVSHDYLRRILAQYKSFGLQPATLLFSVLTALGAISSRSFIKRLDNMPIMLNHGSLIVGKTGSNKSSYIKLIRHGINTLGHHYHSIYNPDIDRNANKIDVDQVPPRTDQELSSTASRLIKASFMTEVCTELAITKNLATTDTFLCHDEGDVILTTFGFYSPSDSKHSGGINLFCSALDGLVNYSRTTGRQSINVKNSTLSMLLATTGSKMSSTLQVMHQKKENVGVLGRLNIWYLPSHQEFLPPRNTKLVSDIASIDHLLIIAHEIFQHSPEFRFKKHASDVTANSVIADDDPYMKTLRVNQGIDEQNTSNLPVTDDEYQCDIFDVCPNDLTDDGGAVSAFKLMLSILNSDFKTSQQMDEHLVGCVRKGLSKLPKTCALLCLFEIIGDIASNLLKFIDFDEGNFSRPLSTSNKFVSVEFVNAVRHYVTNYLVRLPVINNRPIIYIDKRQVERAYVFYAYVETTTKMLFDTTLINQSNQVGQENSPTNQLSKKEKQEISWIVKLLKTPVIFFSNNYLGKSIPGCAGSGVFKNISADLRIHILNIMKGEGLLLSDLFLSGMKTNSFAKVPPSVLRQNESSIKLFAKFGASFTLNNYEKMFDNFGLVTASDATNIPLAPLGVKLLRENDSYVNYYHCLDKDDHVLKMIQDRIALKEINLVSYYESISHRYELIVENERTMNSFSDRSVEGNDANVNDDLSSITVGSKTNRSQKQIIDIGFEEQLNSSVLNSEMINTHQYSSTQPFQLHMTLTSSPINQNDMPGLTVDGHLQLTSRNPQQQCDDSLTGVDSRSSLSNMSSSSVDYQNQLQSTPIALSPLSSSLFKSVLNMNGNLSLYESPLADLSSIIEHNLLPSDSILEGSQILLDLPPSITESSEPMLQSLSATQVCSNNPMSSTVRSQVNEQIDLFEPETDNQTSTPISSQSIVAPQALIDYSNQMEIASPLSTDELQLTWNITGNVPVNTSLIELSLNSIDPTVEQSTCSSTISIQKKKRGRKPNNHKNLDSVSTHDTESVQITNDHPVLKRLILLDGFVFSKSDLTHALQQYANLRDQAIEKLCKEGIFMKEDVFARRLSTGKVEYLEGYIKRCPTVNDDKSINIEESINFGETLGGYDVTHEEYINSFNNQQTLIENPRSGIEKRIINRSSIKLTSFLFSTKLVEYINKNDYFRQRFSIDADAICSNEALVVPTTSNTLTDEYQKMQIDQIKQHQRTKKRAFTQIQDNTGPAPRNARRRS